MMEACAQRWIDLPDHPAKASGEAARVRFARWGLDWAGRVQAQALGKGDSAALSPLGGANGLIRTGEGALRAPAAAGLHASGLISSAARSSGRLMLGRIRPGRVMKRGCTASIQP
jgi:hypothetical protein